MGELGLMTSPNFSLCLRFLKMNNNEFANQVKRNGRIRFDDLPELLPLLTIFHQYIVSFKG